mgnify:FL=1
MYIISAKLSGEAKVRTKPTRTEGLSQNSGQGQSVDRETAMQNITDPRVRAISKRDEKVRRYPLETVGCEIINSLQHLSGPYTLRCQNPG